VELSAKMLPSARGPQPARDCDECHGGRESERRVRLDELTSVVEQSARQLSRSSASHDTRPLQRRVYQSQQRPCGLARRRSRMVVQISRPHKRLRARTADEIQRAVTGLPKENV
jgi:hypothetical protein